MLRMYARCTLDCLSSVRKRASSRRYSVCTLKDSGLGLFVPDKGGAMNIHVWTRVLVIAGLIGMLVGAVDPLEGCVVILLGVALAAGGAYLGQTRHRTLLYWAAGLVAFGVAAMLVLSSYGGIGGRSGHSMWWGVLLVPYPVGWVMGLVGTVFALIEFYRLHSLPKHGLQ